MRADDHVPAWADEPVQIVDADPQWSFLGEAERFRVEGLLKPWLVGRVEHIGSTSIPGLAAKPIIDLQAPVAELTALQPLATVLAQHDCFYVDPEVDKRPWRRFFVRVSDGKRCAHLHVLNPDHPRWTQQLVFRDALRSDSNLADEYAELKQRLAAEHAGDREAYSAAKADFVSAVIETHDH